MERNEIIKSSYAEAVKGLNKAVLNEKDLWYSYVINLPIRLQVVYTVVVFHQQVMNGGLHQYFFNSYGQFSFLTIDNLKLIKAFQSREILKQALAEVNREQLGVNEFREKAFNRKLERIVDFDEALFSFLDELDTKYYALKENLDDLMIIYLEGHLSE